MGENVKLKEMAPINLIFGKKRNKMPLFNVSDK